MGKRTGKPRGRPQGARSKGSKARDEAIQTMAARLGEVIPGAFEGDSHELLMSVYRNPELPLLIRIDAAKSAIGYERPRLAAVEHSGEMNINPHEERLKSLIPVLSNGHASAH